MAFENLTEREKQILYNLIGHYVKSADPVGSRVIANRFKMGISSATIRNTLQDLEELGLVEQPHTSAGRIPTDLGYRVYVDYLFKPQDLTQQEKDHISGSILKEGRGVRELLGQTSRVLSDITRQLGVTTAPEFEEGILKHMDLIPVSDERIMVVVVVKSGLARSLVLEVQASIGEKDLKRVELILNERLVGLTLGEIRDTIAERMSDLPEGGRLLNLIVDSKEKIWASKRAQDIHIAGTDRLVRKPEFSNVEDLSALMKVLGDEAVLSEFLDAANEEGLVITIGKENKFSEIVKCSMVTSSYRVGNITGTIGIIGPTRMEYGKLVSVVEYTARTLTDVLSGMDEGKGSVSDG
jgi:heat-inducible transcriptional repressor